MHEQKRRYLEHLILIGKEDIHQYNEDIQYVESKLAQLKAKRKRVQIEIDGLRGILDLDKQNKEQ